MTTITIEALEQLAETLEGEETEKRSKLIRIIRAQARILAQRAPNAFKRMATECADDDGHWDNSFPPSIEYKNHTGPRLFQVYDNRTDDIATSGGFYHSWKRVTTDPGLWVRRDGRLFGCNETGTGELGQFAARPGDCNVEVELDWFELDEDEIPVDELEEAVKVLREALAKSLADMDVVAA